MEEDPRFRGRRGEPAILRIEPRFTSRNSVEVELTFAVGNRAPLDASTAFTFDPDAQAEKDLDWYLESFGDGPVPPNSELSSRVERWMAALGESLFEALFARGDQNRRLWDSLRPLVDQVDVRIYPDLRAAHAIPWELVRQPDIGSYLALRARTFAYAAGPRLTDTEEPLSRRILLVISRPHGPDDVEYLVTAKSVLAGLDEAGRADLEVEVLRPPTFERLRERLDGAAREGRPFGLVHFDGHGEYDPGDGSVPTVWLAFERETGGEDRIDGRAFTQAVAASSVRAVVLGACRSAYAAVPDSPLVNRVTTASPGATAFASLAQLLSLAGIGGVLAMGHRVRASAVSLFSRAFYAALGRGESFEQAAAAGRRDLGRNPLRQGHERTVRVQDWMAPQTHLASAGLRWPEATRVKPDRAAPAMPEVALPSFAGRDDSVMDLERAFLRSRRVLLRGEASSGKTALACAFASWYARTGGCRGAVHYSSLRGGAKIDRSPRDAALWIVDGLEVLHAPREVDRLETALEDAERSGARTLLLARSATERVRSGASQVELEPLDERQALAVIHCLRGRREEQGEEFWRPLVRASAGNAGTLAEWSELVLAAKPDSPERVEAILSLLVTGEPFPDVIPMPVRRGLAAELERIFRADDLRRLGVLHLCRGGVQTLVLRGLSSRKPAIPVIGGMDDEAWEDLLSRVERLGLARRFGEDAYRIHPMLPGLLREAYRDGVARDEGEFHIAYTAAVATGALFLSVIDERDPDKAAPTIRLLKRDFELALRMARYYQMEKAASHLSQILGTVFGRRGEEWKGVVTGMVGSDEPKADPRETEYGRAVATMARADVLLKERRYSEAAEFLRAEIAWFDELLAKNPTPPDGEDQTFVDEHLAALLRKLGAVLEESGDPECIDAYARAYEIALAGSHDTVASHAAVSLGGAYYSIDERRDLNLAADWIGRGMALQDEHDRDGRAVALAKLAQIDAERWRERKAAGRSPSSLHRIFDEAVSGFERALEVLPPRSLTTRGAICNAVGMLLEEADQFDRALDYFKAAKTIASELGDPAQQAGVMTNQCVALVNSDRLHEAKQLIGEVLLLLEDVENSEELRASALEKQRDIDERIAARSAQRGAGVYDEDDRYQTLVRELLEIGAEEPFVGEGPRYDSAGRHRRARTIGANLRRLRRTDEASALDHARARVLEVLGERRARELDRAWYEL